MTMADARTSGFSPGVCAPGAQARSDRPCSDQQGRKRIAQEPLDTEYASKRLRRTSYIDVLAVTDEARKNNTSTAQPAYPKETHNTKVADPDEAHNTNAADHPDDEWDGQDPVEFWAKEGNWPRQYFKRGAIDHMIARKRSVVTLSRKRSNSASSAAPSDQKPREEKGQAYLDARYELLLQTKNSFMNPSDLGLADSSKRLVERLLSSDQKVPSDTVFDDDIFADACRNLQGANEDRILRDVSRLIVPSAERTALRDKSLKGLVESVNAGWNNSLPLTGTRPQPDYAVGFKRWAFNEEQLAKIAPIVGDFIEGDQSLFMGTYSMYFPFLTCEVQCGAGTLDVADRQNAHSMTLAVRAVAELFVAVKRSDEVHRQILGFSVSHDHTAVRIFGHYPIIDGKNIKYYRHPIRKFDFTEQDGKERWTAYRFIKSLYAQWVPEHLRMICSAIDQLPADLLADPEPPQPHHQFENNETASASAEQESLSGRSQKDTPKKSFTDDAAANKRRAL